MKQNPNLPLKANWKKLGSIQASRVSLNLVSQLTDNYSLDMQTYYSRSLATEQPKRYGLTYF